MSEQYAALAGAVRETIAGDLVKLEQAMADPQVAQVIYDFYPVNPLEELTSNTPDNRLTGVGSAEGGFTQLGGDTVLNRGILLREVVADVSQTLTLAVGNGETRTISEPLQRASKRIKSADTPGLIKSIETTEYKDTKEDNARRLLLQSLPGAMALTMSFVMANGEGDEAWSDIQIAKLMRSIRDDKRPDLSAVEDVQKPLARHIHNFYHQANSPQFLQRLFKTSFFLHYVRTESERKDNLGVLSPGGTERLVRLAITHDPSFIADLGISQEQYIAAARSFEYHYTKSGAVSQLLQSTHTTEGSKKISASLRSVAGEVQRTLVARAVVDHIVGGEISINKLWDAYLLLMSHPLQDDQERLPVPEELVDWEIIPPSEGVEHQPGDGEDDSEYVPSTIDPERKARLERYITLWGSGYMARSKIPKLKDNQQYYVAVLPETLPDGRVIEHAVADNKTTQKHAVFLWRAERGIGRFGQTQRTWREVYCYDKKILTQIGTRRILHTDTLDDKILEYLTRPANRLKDRRYLYSLGKRALANAKASF